MKAIGPVGVFSVVVLFVSVEMVGEVLVEALTKTVKVAVTRLLEAPPSLTVSAIRAVPLPDAEVLNRTLPEFPGVV